MNETAITLHQCPGCKVALPYEDYPADNRYGVLSAECRKALDEILVKEGENYGYPAVHRLIIDSYWVQHPPLLEYQLELGINKRFIDASIQSVSVHLIALYLAIEKKVDLKDIARVMDRILTNMNHQGVTFSELEPPVDLGAIRAIDIRQAVDKNLNLQEYEHLAWKWAHSAWNAWHLHHKTVHNLYEAYK